MWWWWWGRCGGGEGGGGERKVFIQSQRSELGLLSATALQVQEQSRFVSWTYEDPDKERAVVRIASDTDDDTQTERCPRDGSPILVDNEP
jgi:hypothetical protein